MQATTTPKLPRSSSRRSSHCDVNNVLVGTRRSPLARKQTALVCDRLRAVFPDLAVRTVEITTTGDQLTGPLRGENKGLFTSELEEVLMGGDIDFAVHSLKDLPVAPRPEVPIRAILARETARDVLMSIAGGRVGELPHGASIGTSSRRRRAQLLAWRPDLEVVPVRGNVGTRLSKMRAGQVDALVLAAAGLTRLGIDYHDDAVVPMEVMLPAPGQGALAVQCRADRPDAAAMLAAIDCPGARRTTTAERAFLAALGGGCAAPIAAYARQGPSGRLMMRGLVATLDGARVIRVAGEGKSAEALGRRLADVAWQKGAAEVLREL